MRSALLGLALLLSVVAFAEKEVSVTGWVSDESCGADHRKPGGEDCVQKCIKGAPHLNPKWTAQRLVFVTDDETPSIWVVANPPSLTGHEGKHMNVEGKLDDEGRLTVTKATPVEESRSRQLAKARRARWTRSLSGARAPFSQ